MGGGGVALQFSISGRIRGVTLVGPDSCVLDRWPAADGRLLSLSLSASMTLAAQLVNELEASD